MCVCICIYIYIYVQSRQKWEWRTNPRIDVLKGDRGGPWHSWEISEPLTIIRSLIGNKIWSRHALLHFCCHVWILQACRCRTTYGSPRCPRTPLHFFRRFVLLVFPSTLYSVRKLKLLHSGFAALRFTSFLNNKPQSTFPFDEMNKQIHSSLFNLRLISLNLLLPGDQIQHRMTNGASFFTSNT